jgi:flagellar biosynthesis/type III secretory pathway chaperone
MNDASSSLIAVLKEQIACAEAMLATLGRENEALVAGDAERLNAAGAEKARLVDSLEALEQERKSLCDAIGAGFAPSLGAEDSSSPSWQTLLELIAQCKRENQRNGALVKARSEQVRVALQALRGTEPTFYDPSGLTPSPRSARPLGTA